MPVFLRVFLTIDKLVSVTEPGLAACHLKKKSILTKVGRKKLLLIRMPIIWGGGDGRTVDSVFGHESSQGKKGSKSR